METLNREQYQRELESLFTRFDQDNDGSITIKEIKQIFSYIGQSISETELQNMVNEMDKDGNGSIEKTEFVSVFLEKLLTSNNSEEIDRAFQYFDKESNDKIYAKDLQRILQELGEDLEIQEVEKLIKVADKQNKGYVIKEDLQKMFENNQKK